VSALSQPPYTVISTEVRAFADAAERSPHSAFAVAVAVAVAVAFLSVIPAGNLLALKIQVQQNFSFVS
jgi:hypothetical protein